MLIHLFPPILWLSNLEQAQQQAQQEEKPILLVFSGSDWCKPCIRLERSVFQSDTFSVYADSNLVLVRADFPRKQKLSRDQKRHNESLAERYNPKGIFPQVLLLDAEGTLLYRFEKPAEDPEIFLQTLEKQLTLQDPLPAPQE